MGKVFRLFKEGSNTYNDWNASADYPYDATNRESIIDPEGATASKEITSIPSPFARIDLVKNAFAYICRQNLENPGYLEGNTIYHKLVSETLDVGEIFFNISKFRNEMEIIRWNPEQGIKDLLNSQNEGNMCLGDVLQKYLKSDSSAYNFRKMKNLYLLNYKHGPMMLNIVGATSPATIFFSNANDNSYLSERMAFGQHKPFGDSYEPLYKRDVKYIKTWYSFKKGIPNFSELFPEIDEYLNQNFTAIKDVRIKDEIQNVQAYDSNLEEIKLPKGTDIVEVVGYSIFAQKASKIENSEFEILSDRDVLEKPLVLPVEAGNVYGQLSYTSSIWGNNNSAPEKDNRKLEERTLPFDGTKQPYLTIGDFFEDNIISVPHILNSENYFDGNIPINNDGSTVSFLLPVKPLYFHYFTAEDLFGLMHDGKKAFEMFYDGNNIKTILRIPIRGNGDIKYMEYVKTYGKYTNAKISETSNNIKQLDFTAFITPNVKFDKAKESYYTAALITTDEKTISFDFYEKDTLLTDIPCYSRTSGEALTKAKTYTIEGKKFEYIRVKEECGYSGLIVPRFRPNCKLNTFEFAVDLGTSFTHIEYKCSNSIESATYGYDENDTLICEVFLPKQVKADGKITQWDLLDEQPLLEKDYIPVLLGKTLHDKQNNMIDYGFPTQTVLSCSRSVAWDKKFDAFTLVNIPFTYGKRRDLPHNRYYFNIKWGGEQERLLLDKYIDCLCLLLRNKVLMNNGDVEKTKIIWSYPQSMSQSQTTNLGRIWNDKYNKYFAPAPAKTDNILESIAPIRYYFSKIASSSNIINIDIGGGTTDIAYATNKRFDWVTSFRFAMNDIFRDAIADENTGNGIIDYFKPKIKSVLENNNLSELVAVFDAGSNKRPENMASFFFSLKDNQITKNVDKKLVDFDYILEVDDKFKIVFLLFYTAIVYHVAQILKCSSLSFPRHIAFSGNGAYVVKILSSNMESVAQYTKSVLENVLETKCNHNIDIVGLEYNSNPKTVTCKGALIHDSEETEVFANEVILKATGTGFADKDDTYASIDDTAIGNTVKSVEKFFDFALVKLLQKVDIENLFGISEESVRLAKEVCSNDIGTYLKKMLQKTEKGDKNKKIEETLFFYPIKGVLTALSQNLYDKNK